MDISKFDLAEAFNNSKGKTSLALLCAAALIATGCIIGIKGAFTAHGESLLQGLGYATLGTSLLGIRRFTPDKEIPREAKTPDCPPDQKPQ